MDSAELSDWAEFLELEPEGGPQEDLRCGLLASLFFNAHRGKRQRALEPADFFPSLPRAQRRQLSAEEQREGWTLAAIATGGLRAGP